MNTFVIVLLLGLNSVYSQWLDPHEMKFDLNYKKLKRGHNNNPHDLNYEENKHDFKERWTKQEETSASDEQTLLFMKRFVNLIYSSMDVDFETASDTETSAYIYFLITKEHMQFLADFSKITVLNISKLSELDQVLTSSIQQTSFFKKQIRSASEQLSNLLQDKVFIYYSIIGLIILFSIICYLNQTPVGPLLKYMVFGTFLISIYLIYDDALEEKNRFDDKPCLDSSWYAFLFGQQLNCKQLEKRNVFLNVVGVVAEGIFVKPFNYLGSGIGVFINKLFDNLSFFQKFTVGPIVTLLFFILLFVGLMVALGKRLEFNMFPFIRIGLGGDRVYENRTFVEDVVQNPIENKPHKREHIRKCVQNENAEPVKEESGNNSKNEGTEEGDSKKEICTKCKEHSKGNNSNDLITESEILDESDDTFETVESVD